MGARLRRVVQSSLSVTGALAFVPAPARWVSASLCGGWSSSWLHRLTRIGPLGGCQRPAHLQNGVDTYMCAWSCATCNA
jgi:hypothetical protein